MFYNIVGSQAYWLLQLIKRSLNMEELLDLSSKQLLFHPNWLSSLNWITCTFIPSMWRKTVNFSSSTKSKCVSVHSSQQKQRIYQEFTNREHHSRGHDTDYMVVEAAANFSCNVDITSQEMHEKIRTTLHITRLFVGLERAACDTTRL